MSVFEFANDLIMKDSKSYFIMEIKNLSIPNQDSTKSRFFLTFDFSITGHTYIAYILQKA